MFQVFSTSGHRKSSSFGCDNCGEYNEKFLVGSLIIFYILLISGLENSTNFKLDLFMELTASLSIVLKWYYDYEMILFYLLHAMPGDGVNFAFIFLIRSDRISSFYIVG